MQQHFSVSKLFIKSNPAKEWTICIGPIRLLFCISSWPSICDLLFCDKIEPNFVLNLEKLSQWPKWIQTFGLILIDCFIILSVICKIWIANVKCVITISSNLGQIWAYQPIHLDSENRSWRRKRFYFPP